MDFQEIVQKQYADPTDPKCASVNEHGEIIMVSIDKMLEYNERVDKLKAKKFLVLNVDVQRNFVQERLLSNHFIKQIYPYVDREIQDQIIRCQRINRKTFDSLPKENFNWKAFCQNQPLILDANFLREWQDYLNWGAISTRCDLTLEILREFKDNIDWEVVKIWNCVVKNSAYHNNEKIEKEFGRLMTDDDRKVQG